MVFEQAYAKINLSLDITGKREDGYHEVRMVMQTVDLCDALSFSKGKPGTGIVLRTDNEALNTEQSEGKDNLVVKAARVLFEYVGKAEDVEINLSKHIPMAAGMAGGSADAAATFSGLNRLFEYKLSDDELEKMAIRVGADVPFCIRGGLDLCEGIGEVLTPLKALGNVYVTVCKPDVDVATGMVYKTYDSVEQPIHPDVEAMLKAISDGDAGKTAALMGNALEPVTVGFYPVIKEIEEFMEAGGAIRSIMTGSGPTVFGLFKSARDADMMAAALKGKYPGYSVHRTCFFNM